MDDLENATKTLHDLHALGIKLSIDDFGTGYSSLAYIKLLPVDILKIDRSFVTGLPYDVQDNAIVKVIIMLAQALNLKVVAEGVETREQLNFLVENNCDYIQGYYYSKPVPSADFTRLLQKNRQMPAPQ
jgi:EAL domain-containing protein (putative c-di-GMP-specific phosphodiesterase class I)